MTQLPAIVRDLEDAVNDSRQWLAIDADIQQLSASDLNFFETEYQANVFKEFNEQHQKNILLIPSETAYSFIEAMATQAFSDGIKNAIWVNLPQLTFPPDTQHLNDMRAELETELDAFNWNEVFYEPREETTEDLPFPQQVEFNRLEFLVESLSAYAQTSPEAREWVRQSVQRHWSKKPMEIQIPFVVNNIRWNAPETGMTVQKDAHPISQDVLDKARIELASGKQWVAYSNSLYQIEKEHLHFFLSREDAHRFAFDNNSDHDFFNVVKINRPEDLLPDMPVLSEEIFLKETNRSFPIDPDANPLHNNDGNAFTDAVIDHWEKQQLSNHKINLMNENNSAYVKDNVKYTGFGESTFDEIDRNIKEQKPEFQIHFTTKVNNRPFNATLYFRKSDKSNMYFFNSYKASLERSNGEIVEQTFYINKGKGITAKEAYNLLDGRAVYKEMQNKDGQAYKAWLQLDFENKDKHGNYILKQYHDSYGYDLTQALSRFSVLEMDGAEKEKELMRSLQKGNLQAVTMEINGQHEKMFVEANPQYKTINVYNSEFKLMKHEDLQVKPQQEPTQAVQPEAKPDLIQDQNQAVKQTTKQKPEQKNGNGLINKKRTRNQKGIKIN